MQIRDMCSLPAEVLNPLAEGDPVLAGHRLRAWGEKMARTTPGAARRWAQGTSLVDCDEPVFAAFLEWTAGVIFHLVGAAEDAAARLDCSARSLAQLGHKDLADRARLLLVDVHGERLQLARARRLAGALEKRFTARGDHQRAAVALANLACAEDAADRIGRAAKLWQRSLRSLEPGGLRHLLTRANLANVAAVRGQLDTACAEHLAVAEQARKHGLDAVTMQAELNLAEAEFAAGRLDDALVRWHTVITDAKNAGNDVLELSAEVDLAQAEVEVGDGNGAIRRLKRILPRLTDAGLDSEEAIVLRLLAVAEAVDGVSGGWRTYLPRMSGPALRRQRDLLVIEVAQLDASCDPDAIVRAARRLAREGLRHRSLIGLSWAARRYLDAGQTRPAIRLAREVLAKRGVSPWARLVAHHVLGRSGCIAASRHLFYAARLADGLHGRLAATADRSAFLKMRGNVYLDLLSTLLDRNRPADRRRALDLLSRFRSSWLVDELARRADRGDDPAVRNWQQLRRRLAALLSQTEGQNEVRVRRSGLRLADELRSVEGELAELESALARRWTALASTSGDKEVSEILLESLPAGHCFVEYFVEQRDLIVFVAERGRIDVHRQRGIAPEIRRLAESAKFHLDSHTWVEARYEAQTRKALEHTLSQLGRLLLDCLPKSGWHSLWLAPHSVLYQLPWPALMGTGGLALIDRGRLSLVPGAGPLAVLLNSSQPEPQSMALSGAPSDTLPQVAEEVRALGEIFANGKTVEAVTRRDFLQMLECFDVVHLAGHAVFLDGLPAASGLRLVDGYATVHDLAATQIKAQLVTFGVCSGVRVSTHDEHRHEGFLRSLMAGGVRSVVGPVSAVKDETAYAFDLGFYRELAISCDPGAAYRAAINSLRERNTNPAVWGTFHFYGDMRAWGTL